MSFNPKVRVFGVTFLEMLVVLTITSVLASVATPAIVQWRNRSRLSYATETLRSDLKTAMSHNIKAHTGVELAFTASEDGQSWCYALYKGDACDCNQEDICETGEVIFKRTHSEFPSIRLLPAIAHSKFSFRSFRRTVTAGSIQLSTEGGSETKVVVSGYGRIRACSPAGKKHMSGFPNC